MGAVAVQGGARQALEAIEARAREAARAAAGQANHELLFVVADRLDRLARLAHQAGLATERTPAAAEGALRHLAGQANLLALASAAELTGPRESGLARQVGAEVRRLATDCERLGRHWTAARGMA